MSQCLILKGHRTVQRHPFQVFFDVKADKLVSYIIYARYIT